MRVEEAREIYLFSKIQKDVEKIEKDIKQMAALGYRSTGSYEVLTQEVVRYFEDNGFCISSDNGNYKIRW